jgi:hypothetical protein
MGFLRMKFAGDGALATRLSVRSIVQKPPDGQISRRDKNLSSPF